MSKLTYYFFVLLINWMFLSCGTVQPFVPGIPLKKGDVQGRLVYSFSTSNFAGHSIQSGLYFGISDNDLIGFSANNFPLVIPSHITYSHYFPSKTNSISSLQFHVGELLRNEYNPFYEFDYALSDFGKNNVNTIKIGVGYFGPTFIRNFSLDSISNFNLIPTFGLQTFTGDFVAGIDLFPGLTKNYSHRIISRVKQNEIFLTVSHSEIVKIIDIDKNEGKGVGYKIIFKNGDNLYIADRDPYVDCIFCGISFKESKSYLFNSKYNSFWIYSKTVNPKIIWLDINSVLEDFRLGKDLVFKTNEEPVNQIIQNADDWTEDISFGVGIFNRK